MYTKKKIRVNFDVMIGNWSECFARKAMNFVTVCVLCTVMYRCEDIDLVSCTHGCVVLIWKSKMWSLILNETAFFYVPFIHYYFLLSLLGTIF